MTSIIINGKRKELDVRYATYEDLAFFAFPKAKAGRVWTVTYLHKKGEGSLTRGERVLLYDDMIINVRDTSGA